MGFIGGLAATRCTCCAHRFPRVSEEILALGSAVMNSYELSNTNMLVLAIGPVYDGGRVFAANPSSTAAYCLGPVPGNLV